MLLLLQALQRRFPRISTAPLYRLLKKNIFGIYLFHPVIIYWLFSKLSGLHLMPTALVTAVSLASLAVSILAAALMRRLRLRIPIGE